MSSLDLSGMLLVVGWSVSKALLGRRFVSGLTALCKSLAVGGLQLEAVGWVIKLGGAGTVMKLESGIGCAGML